MSKFEYKNFEVKSIDLNEQTNEMFIEGYASNFGNKDEKQISYIPEISDLAPCSDIVVKGAFKKTLSERKGRIAFCKNHDIDDAKGKIIELKEDETGLFVKIRISDAENDLKIKIKEGIYSEFSIGFKTLKATYEKQKDNSYIRNVIEVKLYEVSIVTIARNERSRITDIKSIQQIDTLIEDILKETKNENIHSKLLQLKSLMTVEPDDEDSLKNCGKPKLQKKKLEVFEFTFNQ